MEWNNTEEKIIKTQDKMKGNMNAMNKERGKKLNAELEKRYEKMNEELGDENK